MKLMNDDWQIMTSDLRIFLKHITKDNKYKTLNIPNLYRIKHTHTHISLPNMTLKA